VRTREPITRANLVARSLRQAAHCRDAGALATLSRSRVWPVRLSAAHAWRVLATQHAAPVPDARAQCSVNDPNAHVRAACSGQPSAFELDRSDPDWGDKLANYRALVLSDGRVLVSALDAAGETRWPGVRTLSTENPWQWAYGSE
jgi:hypothetical protein